jgi:formylglycine-generating enzyme required for sulfatase activity
MIRGEEGHMLAVLRRSPWLALAIAGCTRGAPASSPAIQVDSATPAEIHDGQFLTLVWHGNVTGPYALFLQSGTSESVTVLARGAADANHSTVNLIPATAFAVGENELFIEVLPARADVSVKKDPVDAGALGAPCAAKGACPAMDDVPVAAGSFTMGSPAGVGDADESPSHTVSLPAFYIDRTEVTNAAYAACAAALGCLPPARASSATRASYYGNAQFAAFPVINVTFAQAEAYCSWVGKRLPTEAEWEKAARGAMDARQYPWGDTAPTCTVANTLAAGGSACAGDTTPVASFPATSKSPVGAVDMCGNVWEWVADWYDPAYYANSPSLSPPGPTSGTQKVIRGGGFQSPPEFGRVANRLAADPATPLTATGFRCARDAPSSP